MKPVRATEAHSCTQGTVSKLLHSMLMRGADSRVKVENLKLQFGDVGLFCQLKHVKTSLHRRMNLD